MLEGVKPTFLIGARSRDQLLFKERLSKLLGLGLIVSTDDGSEGFHGYASNYAGELMTKGGYRSGLYLWPRVDGVKDLGRCG